MDVLPFDSDQVLLRARLAITRHLPGPQLPTKAHPPQQVQHRLVIHHLRWRHQHLENDAGKAFIYHIVDMLAHIRLSPKNSLFLTCGIYYFSHQADFFNG